MPITASAPPGPRSAVSDATGVLQVIAENPHSLQDELSRAVEQVRSSAGPGDRRGILLTRHGPTLFTVEPGTGVPYGTTLERDYWHRRTGQDTAGQPGAENH